MEVCRSPLEVESVHDPTELLPDVVGRLETPVVDEVVVTPLGVLHVLFKCVEYVEESQMVAINVGKSQLGVVRCFLCFIGSKYREIKEELYPAVLTNLTKHWGTESMATMERISLLQLYSQLAINILAS